MIQTKYSGFGRTTLAWAAYYGQVEVVRLFLDNGTNVNAKGKSGQVSLHRGTWDPTWVAAMRLLNIGAIVNTKCNMARHLLTQHNLEKLSWSDCTWIEEQV